MLRQGIQGISELITLPGLINLDFADVRAIMAQGGAALMAIGYGEGDNKAVRLVYRMASNEYWGVQMTDWDDAPALAGKSQTRRIKGRTYDLYYNGPKLHMVVLRTPDASYWVVNTLLDRMSNETMLAIAKGLKPIGAVKG